MKQKKGFFQDCLKDKKRATYVAFLSLIFFKKDTIIKERREKRKNKT